mgnify:CR=1 FL=1
MGRWRLVGGGASEGGGGAVRTSHSLEANSDQITWRAAGLGTGAEGEYSADEDEAARSTGGLCWDT